LSEQTETEMIDKAAKERRFRLKDLRHGAEIVAILGAGIWAFYTFIYVERIKPLGQEPILDVSVAADTTRTSSGFDFVTIHLKYKDSGTWNMAVVAEGIDVYGESVQRDRRGAQSSTPTGYLYEPGLRLRDASLIQAWVSRFRGAALASQASQFLMLPGQEFDEERTVVVRHQEFPALRIQYYAYFSKSPVTTPIRIDMTRGPDGSVSLTAKTSSDTGELVVPLP
jgi:hypothetical protein